MVHRLVLTIFVSLSFWVGNAVSAEKDSVTNAKPTSPELESAIEKGRRGIKFEFSGVHICINHDRFEALRNTLQVSGDTSSVTGCVLVPEPAHAIVLVKKYTMTEPEGCVRDVEIIGDLDPDTGIVLIDAKTGVGVVITDNVSILLHAKRAHCEEGET